MTYFQVKKSAPAKRHYCKLCGQKRLEKNMQEAGLNKQNRKIWICRNCHSYGFWASRYLIKKYGLQYNLNLNGYYGNTNK